MAELLLEILSEEIPARMQARAAEDLRRLVAENLTAAGLSFSSARAFATPRRLALVVDGLPERRPDQNSKRKGPKIGSPRAAILGAMTSVGLSSDEISESSAIRILNLTVNDEPVTVEGHAVTVSVSAQPLAKGPTYIVASQRKEEATKGLLPDILVASIMSLSWPKSMHWDASPMTWIRPIRRVLCLFGHDVLGVNLPTAVSELENVTLGHRFLSSGPIEVHDFADYEAKLRAAKVILDPAERKAMIKRQADALAAREGLKLKDDPALLDEVTGLVEWPAALMGRIDPAFMDLPAEVLTASMRAHQKYFSLLNPDGTLAPRFVVVANIEAADGGAAITAGNERVLRARLSDAKFFWDQDRKTPLADRVPALDKIVFHAKLGSLGQKVARVAALAADLCDHIPGAEREAVRSAAMLAKADLTTGMVGEFPELQGVMGRYYALAEGERPAVADAVAEHYAPKGPDDRCPSAPVSVAVALADKLDSLFWFFAIGETPTGSKDPFALRRSALGVIRLIVENKLRVPLQRVFDITRKLSPSDDLSRHGRPERTLRVQEIIDRLMDFFADRLKVHLRERGVRHDLVSAAFALGGEDDLVRLLGRVDALASFVGSDDGANLLTAYKRAANIVAIEEKKDKAAHGGEVDPDLLREDEERALHAALARAGAAFEAALAREDFAAAMAAAASLRRPVDAFFDKVTVNAADKALRANRLRLLSRIRATLNRLADFSRIEG